MISHWITPSFEKREALLDFVELAGAHSGENKAATVLSMLHELEIGPELLTITGDNAGNNSTMCDTLHTELSKLYDDENSEFRLGPLMRFHDRPSSIRYLVYIINLICKDILTYFRAGSVREAKATLDRVNIIKNQLSTNFDISLPKDKNAVVKIRLLVLWIARSP